jgi:hypothetical protein
LFYSRVKEQLHKDPIPPLKTGLQKTEETKETTDLNVAEQQEESTSSSPWSVFTPASPPSNQVPSTEPSQPQESTDVNTSE